MRILLITLGSFFLAIGIIGIFVPLLPTTPFLLLATSLYFRSSPYLYKKLLNHNILGGYIKDFRENKAISKTTKFISITMMWLGMSYAIYYTSNNLWIMLFLIAIGFAITIHILSFKTKKNK